MSGYFIIQINITNPENYKDYITQVTPIVKKFEGEYIINNYKETLNQSDVIIISNWASNTKGNELIKNIFSTAKNQGRV